MKSLRFIPILAGIITSGQVLAADLHSSPTQDQGATATLSAPVDSESRAVPVRLSATELDRVTAGLGRENVATAPWPALLDAGFTLNHNSNADQGIIDHAGFEGLAVPNTVPNSFCFAFC